MYRKIIAAFVAAVALVAVLTQGTAAQESPAATTTTQPTTTTVAVPAYPAGCTGFTTRRHFRWYARTTYRGKYVSKPERRKMRRLRSCAASRADSKWMLRVQIRQARQRHARLYMRCGTPPCNRRLLVYMATRRWGSGQASCLEAIGAHEAGFNHLKYNTAGSGAYGIPQALPGSKMASAGADWATNPATQIRWMMGYVVGRYGSACGAWAYWQAHSSY
jgi:hypothetical protein